MREPIVITSGIYIMLPEISLIISSNATTSQTVEVKAIPVSGHGDL
jgi:hypothetical protein